MTHRALGLPNEQGLAATFLFGGLRGIELAVNVEFWSRWKVEQFLKLCHEVNLASPLENVHTLLCGDHRVAIKVGPALLEFREVLYGFQRALRSKQTLDIHAAQRHRLS